MVQFINSFENYSLSEPGAATISFLLTPEVEPRPHAWVEYALNTASHYPPSLIPCDVYVNYVLRY